MATTTPKIALEEHYIIPECIPYWRATVPNLSDELAQRMLAPMLELGERRIEAMDRAGIEVAVLSLAGSVLREADTTLAVRRAREANDHLFEIIQRYPTRYAGFASLAMQDPHAAADELQRCTEEMGFKGTLLFGHVHGRYYDDRAFDPFWERAAALRVPVYLHPTTAFQLPHGYANQPVLAGPVWGWTVETATHALRLVFGGVFERYPEARLILGHMGETLPYMLWRLDSRWQMFAHAGAPITRAPSEYVRDNISITTAGVCSNAALQCALAELGPDSVMFSTDYPFESIDEAARFIETAPVDMSLRRKLCYQNAARLLGIECNWA